MPIQVTCSSCNSKFNAPDSAAGKRAKCPKCGGAIDIPEPEIEPAEDEIFEAESIPSRPITDDDFADFPTPAPPAGDRKPCPMCGEMIQKDAVKCRYCGETFDPLLRKQEQKLKKASGDPDEDMSTGDWLLAILCSGIGCIAGIVWIIQGKPKGKKMVAVSIAVNIIWAVVRIVLESIAASHR